MSQFAVGSLWIKSGPEGFFEYNGNSIIFVSIFKRLSVLFESNEDRRLCYSSRLRACPFNKFRKRVMVNIFNSELVGIRTPLRYTTKPVLRVGWLAVFHFHEPFHNAISLSRTSA